MKFKLDKEQMEEVIESYEVSRAIIRKVEAGLNETDLVKNEDDYFLLVCEVISQYSSIREMSKQGRDNRYYMNLSEIIVQQLAFYYQNFEYDSYENKIKFNNLSDSIKNRHN